MKALGKLFFVLSVLNLPAMYFYLGGTEDQRLNLIQRLFTMVSIGNLGELGVNCAKTNLAMNNRTFELSCSSGMLDRLDSFGLISIP